MSHDSTGVQLVHEYERIVRLKQSLRAYRFIVLVGVIIALVGLAYLIPALAAEDSKRQTEDLASKTQDVADPILALCQRDDSVARRLAQADLCGKASDALRTAKNVAAPFVTVTYNLDYTAVQAAVAEYCADREQCKGADGETPPLSDIVSAVVARIPVPKDGKDGAPGQDAAPITGEQIKAAVVDYCNQESLPCKGETGPAGAAGPEGAAGEDASAPIEAEFRLLDTGSCVLYLRYPDDTELTPVVPQDLCSRE